MNGKCKINRGAEALVAHNLKPEMTTRTHSQSATVYSGHSSTKTFTHHLRVEQQ